jgi:hypothetical protein
MLGMITVIAMKTPINPINGIYSPARLRNKLSRRIKKYV